MKNKPVKARKFYGNQWKTAKGVFKRAPSGTVGRYAHVSGKVFIRPTYKMSLPTVWNTHYHPATTSKGRKWGQNHDDDHFGDTVKTEKFSESSNGEPSIATAVKGRKRLRPGCGCCPENMPENMKRLKHSADFQPEVVLEKLPWDIEYPVSARGLSTFERTAKINLREYRINSRRRARQRHQQGDINQPVILLENLTEIGTISAHSSSRTTKASTVTLGRKTSPTDQKALSIAQAVKSSGRLNRFRKLPAGLLRKKRQKQQEQYKNSHSVPAAQKSTKITPRKPVKQLVKGRTYQEPEDSDKHIQETHATLYRATTVKLYQCVLCKLQFIDKRQCQKHTASHHPNSSMPALEDLHQTPNNATRGQQKGHWCQTCGNPRSICACVNKSTDDRSLVTSEDESLIMTCETEAGIEDPPETTNNDLFSASPLSQSKTKISSIKFHSKPKKEGATDDNALPGDAKQIYQCAACKMNFNRMPDCQAHVMKFCMYSSGSQKGQTALKSILPPNITKDKIVGKGGLSKDISFFWCGICHTSYDKEQKYEEHMKSHNKEAIPKKDPETPQQQSMETDKKEKRKSSEADNMKVYQCGVCDQKFKEQEECEKHVEEHYINALQIKETKKPQISMTKAGLASKSTPKAAPKKTPQPRKLLSKTPTGPTALKSTPTSEKSTKIKQGQSTATQSDIVQTPSQPTQRPPSPPLPTEPPPQLPPEMVDLTAAESQLPVKLFRCTVCRLIFRDKELCQQHANEHSEKKPETNGSDLPSQVPSTASSCKKDILSPAKPIPETPTPTHEPGVTNNTSPTPSKGRGRGRPPGSKSPAKKSAVGRVRKIPHHLRDSDEDEDYDPALEGELLDSDDDWIPEKEGYGKSPVPDALPKIKRVSLGKGTSKAGVGGKTSNQKDDQDSFMCDECGKVYQRKADLAHHKLSVHQGLKPFACDNCGQAFSRKSDLSLHMKNHHSGEEKQKHPCSLCDKQFVDENRLAQHLKKMHPDGQPILPKPAKVPMPKVIKVPTMQTVKKGLYACPVCFEAFTKKTVYVQHMKKQHGYSNAEINALAVKTENDMAADEGEIATENLLNLGNEATVSNIKTEGGGKVIRLLTPKVTGQVKNVAGHLIKKVILKKPGVSTSIAGVSSSSEVRSTTSSPITVSTHKPPDLLQQVFAASLGADNVSEDSNQSASSLLTQQVLQQSQQEPQNAGSIHIPQQQNIVLSATGEDGVVRKYIVIVNKQNPANPAQEVENNVLLTQPEDGGPLTQQTIIPTQQPASHDPIENPGDNASGLITQNLLIRQPDGTVVPQNILVKQSEDLSSSPAEENIVIQQPNDSNSPQETVIQQPDNSFGSQQIVIQQPDDSLSSQQTVIQQPDDSSCPQETVIEQSEQEPMAEQDININTEFDPQSLVVIRQPDGTELTIPGSEAQALLQSGNLVINQPQPSPTADLVLNSPTPEQQQMLVNPLVEPGPGQQRGVSLLPPSGDLVINQPIQQTASSLVQDNNPALVASNPQQVVTQTVATTAAATQQQEPMVLEPTTPATTTIVDASQQALMSPQAVVAQSMINPVVVEPELEGGLQTQQETDLVLPPSVTDQQQRRVLIIRHGDFTRQIVLGEDDSPTHIVLQGNPGEEQQLLDLGQVGLTHTFTGEQQIQLVSSGNDDKKDQAVVNQGQIEGQEQTVTEGQNEQQVPVTTSVDQTLVGQQQLLDIAQNTGEQQVVQMDSLQQDSTHAQQAILDAAVQPDNICNDTIDSETNLVIDVPTSDAEEIGVVQQQEQQIEIQAQQEQLVNILLQTSPHDHLYAAQ